MVKPSTPRRGGDRLAATLIWGSAALIVTALAWILTDLVGRGLSDLSLSFLVSAPADAGRTGGIGPIIVSTLSLLGVTLVAAVPLSLATAVALAEYAPTRGPFGRVIRRSLDILAAVPSIVFGLFGNALFCVGLGMGYSILAGGLTLACMVLPILIRTAEQAIRGVPDEFRLGAAALGLSRTTTLMRVILPPAVPAVAAGLVLGIGRALAETAALMFTAGYVTRMPESPFDSGRALSVHIYDLAMNVPGANARAYTTAAVLITLLITINVTAALLAQLAARPLRPTGAWR